MLLTPKNLSLVLPVSILSACAYFWIQSNTDKAAIGADVELAQVIGPSRSNVYTGGANKLVKISQLSEEEVEQLGELREWGKVYSIASEGERSSLLEAGVKLAKQRSVLMERLMQSDPKAAIERGLSYAEYAGLPQQIKDLVEQPYSAVVDWQVASQCGGSTAGTPFTLRREGEKKLLQSYSYDGRVHHASKNRLPVSGIQLGGLSAVRAEVFEVVDASDRDFVEQTFPHAGNSKQCFASGQPLGGQAVMALAGGKVFHFSSSAVLAEFEERVGGLDHYRSPDTGSILVIEETAADTGGSVGFGLVEAEQMAAAAAAEWTTEVKKVYVVRVDFSDKPGGFSNSSAAAGVFNGDVADAIRRYSYDKADIEATVSDHVVRMDSSSGSYLSGSNYQDLHSEAIANHVGPLPDYDVLVVLFEGLGYSWSGRASVGGSKMWLDGTISSETITHELGHNFGLRHASYWIHDLVDGSSVDPVNPSGSYEEYGDVFDVMGDGDIVRGDFHMPAKAQLNWLDETDWTDVTGSGQHRVYRFDDISSSGVRGLRVSKGDDEYYWVGYRRNWSGLPNFQLGAYLLWEPDQDGVFGHSKDYNHSVLLDMTPGSSGGKEDAGLALGKTYSDAVAGVHITPVAFGGEGASAYLDMVVNIGEFPDNVPPVASVDSEATGVARVSHFFTAQASDANGDELAYHWDFGDGNVVENAATVEHAWDVGGSYSVTLTVTDMKGGTTTTSRAVTITDPLNQWTQRAGPASNRDYRGLAASETVVVAVGGGSGNSGAYARSTDGTNWTLGRIGSHEGTGGVNVRLQSVDYDAVSGRFIAVGYDYSFEIAGYNDDKPVYKGWEGVIYSSADGVSWSRDLWGGIPILRSVESLDGVVIVVGENGTIYRSTNGTTWSLISVSGLIEDMISVAAGDGQFVAVGKGYDEATSGWRTGDPVVLVSTDGSQWTTVSDSAVGFTGSADFTTTGFVNGKFVASGYRTHIRYSEDSAASWLGNEDGDENMRIHSIAGYGGVALAVGSDYGASGLDLTYSSLDGANWSALSTSAQPDRNAVIFFNNTFITAGNSGAIYQSGSIFSGYDSWILGFTDSIHGVGDDKSNRDGDWANNLMEYALGGSPFIATDAPKIPEVIIENGYPTIVVERDQIRADLDYIVEISDDLLTWSESGLVVVEDSEGLLKVRSATLKAVEPSQFLRFRVSR